MSQHLGPNSNSDSAVANLVFNPVTDQYLVVWSGDTAVDNQSNVFGQLVNADCTSLDGSNFQISATASTSEPDVAYDSVQEQYLVSWHASVNGEPELYRQSLDGNGVEVDGDIRVTNLGPDNNGNFGPGDPTHGLTYIDGSTGCFFVAVASDHHLGGQVQEEDEIFSRRIGTENNCSDLQMTVTENQLGAIELRPIFSYTLSGIGGADTHLFMITPDTSEVVFDDYPDFEMPADANDDNIYEIEVLAMDASGNLVTIRIEITVTDSEEFCSPELLTRYVAAEKWQLLRLPCQPPANAEFSISNLFEHPLDEERWAAYYYDATSQQPAYVEINAGDPIPDQGFWFITLDSVTLTLPANSLGRPTAEAQFCDSGTCYAQVVEPQTTWNLLGNPLDGNFHYSDIQLTNGSSVCSENAPCSLTSAASDLNIDTGIYTYNSFAGAYRQLSGMTGEQTVIKPWDGYWLKITSDTPFAEPWIVYLQRYPSQFMFITDGTYQGDLAAYDQTGLNSGVAGADTICQSEAMKAGLPGTYKAYLSTTATSPSTAFSQLDTPYIRTDGALFANGFSDFLNGTAGQAYDTDMATTATVARLDGFPFAWSASDNAGVYLDAMHTCNDWTSNGPGSGAIGVASNPVNWEHGVNSTQLCQSEYHLYCTQQ